MNVAALVSKRLLMPVVLVVILVALATAPLYTAAGTIPLITSFLMYIILAVSWAMFSGPTGYVSLASAAFFGCGIYASALLFTRGSELLPLPAVILTGAALAFCFAFIVGLATLRVKGIYFTMFSFGLLELARRLVQYYEFNVTGTRGRYVGIVGTDTTYYIMLAILVATLLTVYFIRRSRLGLAMQSIGENEEAAAHMGVDNTRVKVLTFALSAFFMGATGALVATSWLYVDPTIAFNLNYSFLPLLMAIVGGMGQIYGPVIGGLAFAYLRYILMSEAPYYFMLIFGGIMILVVLFLPGGLASLIERGRHRLRRLTAKLWKGAEAEQHANT
jgi:branched-chain amino acid transport system permease protein